jgi:hypothetical protein
MNAQLHPKLIDPYAIYHLNNTLSKCHNTRAQLYSWSLNIGIIIFIVAIIGTYIYYCYKTKPSEYEVQQKMLRDQEYILSKIRYYQNENVNKQVSNIDKLPNYSINNNIDIINRL